MSRGRRKTFALFLGGLGGWVGGEKELLASSSCQ